MGTVTTVGWDAFEGLLVLGSKEKEWTEVGRRNEESRGKDKKRHSNKADVPDYRRRLRR